MRIAHDPAVLLLIILIGALLVVSSVITFAMRRHDPQRALFLEWERRNKAWWVMSAIFALVTTGGPTLMVLLFGAVSWLALREMYIATQFGRTDHSALVLVAYVLLPLQYGLILAHLTTAALVIFPVALMLICAAAAVTSGDMSNALTRIGSLQISGLLAIYCLSTVPALLMSGWPVANEGVHLMLFLSVVVQCADCCQYLAGTAWGRTPLAPAVSPNKTREGFYGGVVGGALLGIALSFLTPFPCWINGVLGAMVATAGALGDLMLSAIKRDRGIKDFSNLIPGHGGILDRVDSLVLAAPVFLVCVRLTAGT